MATIEELVLLNTACKIVERCAKIRYLFQKMFHAICFAMLSKLGFPVPQPFTN